VDLEVEEVWGAVGVEADREDLLRAWAEIVCAQVAVTPSDINAELLVIK
jgi:hypothetical protein